MTPKELEALEEAAQWVECGPQRRAFTLLAGRADDQLTALSPGSTALLDGWLPIAEDHYRALYALLSAYGQGIERYKLLRAQPEANA